MIERDHPKLAIIKQCHLLSISRSSYYHEPKGNCHDNAVAESFFQLLKRERIRRKTYARESVRANSSREVRPTDLRTK